MSSFLQLYFHQILAGHVTVFDHMFLWHPVTKTFMLVNVIIFAILQPVPSHLHFKISILPSSPQTSCNHPNPQTETRPQIHCFSLRNFTQVFQIWARVYLCVYPAICVHIRHTIKRNSRVLRFHCKNTNSMKS